MPIMINSLSSISPTITLAEMFAEQRQYTAAYTIYRYLIINDLSGDTELSIKEIKEKVFNKGNKLSLLSEIFDEKEADTLGVLSSDDYLRFKEVMDVLLDKEITELEDVDLEDNHHFAGIENKINSDWDDILFNEKKIIAGEPVSINSINWSQIKLSDFIGFLIGLKGEGKTLDKLKLSEIMETFLRQYKQDNE